MPKHSLARILVALGAIWLSPVGAVPLSSPEEPGKEEMILETARLGGELTVSHYQEGMRRMQAGELEAATDAFRASLGYDPDYIPTLLAMTELAFRKGKPASAKPWLDRAVEVAPEDPNVQVTLARYRYLQRDFQGSEAALKKATELAPELYTPWLDLGDLYLTSLNRPDAAAEAYGKAIERKPDHAGAHFGLGRALARSGQLEAARASLAQAAELEPARPEPYQALGELAARAGNRKQALAYFDQALQADPSYGAARLARGDVLLAGGDVQTAVKEYRQAAKLPGVAGAAQTKLGVLYQRQGDLEKAKKTYLAAVEADPGSALALNNLAWMSAEQGKDLDRGLEWARQAVALAPGSADALDTLAWVQRARGDLSEASASLEKAVVLAPANATVRYHLGVVYAEQGKEAEAARELQEALRQDPELAEAEQARALLAKLK